MKNLINIMTNNKNTYKYDRKYQYKQFYIFTSNIISK